MIRVRFEKFVGDMREQMFTVPIFVLRLAVWLLPASAVRALLQKGLDLRAILAASRSGSFYRCELEVREKQVEKRLVVSLS